MRILNLSVSAAVLILAVAQDSEDDEYNYTYDEVNDDEVQGGTAGSRLVGARAAKARKEAPFLVAINNWGQHVASGCTGSLLTPTWVLTAAHCTSILDEQTVEERVDAFNSRCVESGIPKWDLKCKYIMTVSNGRKIKNLEMTSKGKVWVGANSLRNLESQPDVKSSNIKRAIRHAHSYVGGGNYGTFGGYDISLLELETPITGFKFACIPRLQFDDIQAGGQLAGYGKYHRMDDRSGQHTCQTNKFGKYKYHYCTKTINEGACVAGSPPENPLCRKFYDYNKDGIKSARNSNFDEIMIVHNNRPVYCFKKTNPEDKRFGWCKTSGNYYDASNPSERAESSAWGYCSQDCHLRGNHGNDTGIGTLRIVDKDVKALDEAKCDWYLERSMPFPVKYRPEILCVGKQYKWNVGVWYTKDEQNYQRITRKDHYDTIMRRFHYGASKDPTGFVTSAGTCNGDSGGPLFLEPRNDFYVVTGIVSGGRSGEGKCGKINNPVHYTRVKKLGDWINQILGPSNGLCWSE